jgi:hypothetical protein
MDRLRSNKVIPGRINVYVIIINSVTLWQHGFCGVVNFSEYINIFPPRYFVKVYFDNILSDNLVSPRVPLTLLKLNTSERLHQRSKDWCKFFPVHGSFIGSRTENTLNLISVEMKNCYNSSKMNGQYIDQCNVLEVVGGRMLDGKGKGSRCRINCDQMITLVIVESGEIDAISQNAYRFFFKFGTTHFPNYMLVFKSCGLNSLTVCRIVYSVNLLDVSLVCEEKMDVSKELFYRMEIFSHKIWSTGAKIAYSPTDRAKYGSVTHKYVIYFESPVEELLTIECLTRANETGTHKPARSGMSMSEQFK